MSEKPTTLLEMAGAPSSPASFTEAALILIDYQREYTEGRLQLKDAASAIAEAERLLAKAREAGAPVFHITHRGRSGSAVFNPDTTNVEIVPELTPRANEPMVTKGLPNAFAGTDLQERLRGTGRKEVIIGGFMTHMCVSSTARAALDLGYRSTVVASACATRALPDESGESVPGEVLHRAELAALGDRFAVIARSVADIGTG